MISTLAGKGDYIILDADSHASIYDGCWLGNAEIVRFRHNSVEDLDKRLGRLPKEAGKLVVLEGVYSMLGDIAPLQGDGRGRQEAWRDDPVRRGAWHGLLRRATAAACTRSRASRTTSISSSAPSPSRSARSAASACRTIPKFEVLRLVCRPYVFTASLPPTVVATAADLDPQADARRTTSARISGRTAAGCTRACAIWASSSAPRRAQSAIIAVILPDQEQAVGMWQALLELRPLREHGAPARDAGRHLSCCAARSAPSIATSRSARSSRCSPKPAAGSAASPDRQARIAQLRFGPFPRRFRPKIAAWAWGK